MCRHKNLLKPLTRVLPVVALALLSINILCASEWQQQVNYIIEVTLDPEGKTLEGNINIEYTNNSPDALDIVYMHAWPNAYSSKSTAYAKQLLELGQDAFHFAGSDHLGDISGFNFQMNGEKCRWSVDKENPDIIQVRPETEVRAGETVYFSTPFKVNLPRISSRLGWHDDNFCISQWYPKPAVYDEEGWHPMPYLEQGEFYSEFGSFQVMITVPSSYKVAAAGNMILSDDSRPGFTTYHYELGPAHDFAWFASKEFSIDRSEAILPDGRTVTLETYYYGDTTSGWDLANAWARRALIYFSEIIGPYPYDQFVIVESPKYTALGMEYPGLTLVEGVYDLALLEATIVHEAAHNWWFAALGSNERTEPWIDEGFTTYYEERYFEEYGPYASPLYEFAQTGLGRFFGLKNLQPYDERKLYASDKHRRNVRQAIDLDSEEYTYENYFSALYVEAPMAIRFLENYLTRDVFDEAIQEFYSTYGFNHIDGTTLQEFLEDRTGRDLSWFFEDLIHAGRNIDIAIDRITRHKSGYEVTLKNLTNVRMPVPVSGINDGETVITRWSKDFEFETTVFLPGEYEEIVADNQRTIPESSYANNIYRTGEKIRKVKPFRFQYLGSLEDPRRTQLFFAPVLAGNAYDKFMLGLALYNRVYPERKFEFEYVPMYAFGTDRFSGIGNMSYRFNFHNTRLNHIYASFQIKSFTYQDRPIKDLSYYKMAPGISFHFRDPGLKKDLEHTLAFRHIFTSRQVGVLSEEADSTFLFVERNRRFAINELSYQLRYSKTLKDITAGFTVHQSKEFVKLMAEASAKFYFRIFGRSSFNSALEVRWFGGIFAYEDISLLDRRFFALSLGSYSGTTDYLYDHYYLGRSKPEGFLSQQYNDGLGGFTNVATIRGLGTSRDRWVTSLNILFSIVKINRIFEPKLYADLGLYRDDPISGDYDTKGLVDLGMSLTFLDGAVAFNFPFYSSDEIKSFLSGKNYGSKISFQLNLNRLNPHRNMKKLEF